MSYNKLFGRISYFLTWDLCLYIYIYILILILILILMIWFEVTSKMHVFLWSLEFLLSKHKHFRNFSKIMNQIVSGSSNLGPSSVSEKLQHSSLALSSWRDLAALTLRLALSSWTLIFLSQDSAPTAAIALSFLYFTQWPVFYTNSWT